MKKDARIEKYTPMSRTLHWLMGVLILGMFALGWGYEYAAPAAKAPILQVHVLVGLSILYLFFLRLLTRFLSTPPSPHGGKLYRVAVTGAHFFLYAAMLLMPVSGWLYLSARGGDFNVLGWFDVPALTGKNRQAAVFFKDFHATLAFLFIAAILAHIAGAFYHRFIKRDKVMDRMLF